jgi:TM2 domain-containing membrane protein YozV
MWMGMYGAHRFYVGKIGTGLLMVFTLGGLGIWWIVDIFKVLSETFEDSEGNVITDQDRGNPGSENDGYHEDPCYPNSSDKTPDSEKELILG